MNLATTQEGHMIGTRPDEIKGPSDNGYLVHFIVLISPAVYYTQHTTVHVTSSMTALLW